MLKLILTYHWVNQLMNATNHKRSKIKFVLQLLVRTTQFYVHVYK